MKSIVRELGTFQRSFRCLHETLWPSGESVGLLHLTLANPTNLFEILSLFTENSNVPIFSPEK